MEVKVTQADREVSIHVRNAWNVNCDTAATLIAEHRIASQAELIEALEKVADAPTVLEGGSIALCRNVAKAAIAKAKGEV